MISLGIVAHAQREKRAYALAEATNAEIVNVDDGTLGCNGNHFYTLDWLYKYPAPRHTVTSKSWAVILEDDAKVGKDFNVDLGDALRKAPTDIVSLYLGRARPEHWQDQIAQVIAADVSFLTAPDLLHAVGYAIRWPLLGSLLNEVPGTHEMTALGGSRLLPVDEAISVWAKKHGHKVSYTKPSIVDHIDGPSLIDSRTTRILYVDKSPGLAPGTDRVAWCFGSRRGRMRKGWDDKVIEIPPPEVIASV